MKIIIRSKEKRSFFIILSFIFISKYLLAQEFDTDRIFIKNQGKTNCHIQAKENLRELRKKNKFSHEHVQFINKNIFYKYKKNITLSKNEKSKLRELLLGNNKKIYPTKNEHISLNEKKILKIKRNCLMKFQD